MIINFFHPGMVIESYFVMPGVKPFRPHRRICVVMSVHTKGILVHPMMPRGASDEAHAVYTKHGRFACELRNIIEAPTSFAIPQTMTDGVRGFAKATLSEPDFKTLREASLDCAYNSTMKSERLTVDAVPMVRRRSA